MTVTRLTRSLAIVLASLLPAMSASSAESALPRDLLDCQREQDSLRRLVCYDREVARAGSLPVVMAPPAPVARAAAPVAIVPPPVAATAVAPAVAAVPPAAAAPSAASTFGEEQVASKRREREESSAQSITAGIVSMKPWRQGANVLTLDNGQVWRQEETESYFPMKDGDTVRIERGMLGSYHLTLVQEGWKKRTRVSRVR